MWIFFHTPLENLPPSPDYPLPLRNMKVKQLLESVVLNKCPKCHNGQVFSANNPFNFRKIFEMNHVCGVCTDLCLVYSLVYPST